jgi:hypothetical protein
MKKVLTILTLLLVLSLKSFSQQWHAVTDTLSLPRSQAHGAVAVSYMNRFDTVFCYYKVSGNNNIYKGYKYVFIMQGFYTDTPNTINVFFDDRKRRVANVERFYFN